MAYKNLPDLRFNGFSGKWKQEKLNNFVKRISETSSSNQYKKIEFSDIDSGILKNKLRNNDSKGIKFLKKDVLFGKLRPYLKNWYYCNFDGIAIGDFWVYRAKKDYSNSTFIYYLIQTEKYNLVSNYTTGTKMPRSDWNIVSNTLFGLPSFNEQQKIGSFFEKLDKLIELQTQKVDQLKKLKRGYLQKMFPQEGETVPRLRFSGFSGEWKEESLSSICRYETSNYTQGQFKESNNVGKHVVFDVSGISGKDSNYDQENEYISIVKDGSGVGTVSLRDAKTSVINTMNYILSDNENIRFIYYLLQNFDFRRFKIGTGIPHIYFSDYSKTHVKVAELDEQMKIASFLGDLDSLILVNENKVESLKTQKKAYLQKMFI